MPGVSQIIFGAMHLKPEDVSGKRVLDVGACDFNGSIRPLVESWSPAEYVGVDIIEGPSVDIVCSADDLIQHFGTEAFDVVICFEMLEHTPDWRASILNMKQVLRPGGILLITTRSLGYPVHGFPHDFWRYEISDFEAIFSDFNFEALEVDPLQPGVFLKAIKPLEYNECKLQEIKLYSVLTNQREEMFSDDMFDTSYCKKLACKQYIKQFVNKSVLWSGKCLSKLLSLQQGKKSEA